MAQWCVYDILSDAGYIRSVGWNETEDDANSLALDDDLCWCFRLAHLSRRSRLSWSCSAVDAVQHLGQQGDNWWTSSEYRLKEPWSTLLKGCGWFMIKLDQVNSANLLLILTGWFLVVLDQYRVVLVDIWCYWTSTEQCWLVFVVLGQYNLVLSVTGLVKGS